MQTKDHIRQSFLARRAAMSPDELQTLGDSIRAHLNSSPLVTNAPAILTYISKDNEVPTHAFIQDCLRRDQPALTPITLPRGQLAWRQLHRWEDLRPGRYGILEPPESDTTPIPPTAVCLVPCVALRTDGHRVGYGKGHFDRFLATHPGPTIALAYDCQLTNDWSPHPHDVGCQYICTERGIIPVAPRRS